MGKGSFNAGCDPVEVRIKAVYMKEYWLSVQLSVPFGFCLSCNPGNLNDMLGVIHLE